DLRSGLNSFISSPWLVGDLFASLAFLGALTGQHIGYILLTMYVSRAFSKIMENLSPIVQANWAKLEAERSLYKSGFLQWIILLATRNYFKVGSSYIALVWLVSPAFAYGLLVATLSSARAPKALKTITLLLGLFVPFLISGGMFIRLAGTVIGIACSAASILVACSAASILVACSSATILANFAIYFGFNGHAFVCLLFFSP
ncbi:hypothetical protein Tco_1088545, partial [Tanacetum coccineum]